MIEGKYAILGDIHGNWEALEAVLKDCGERGVDSLVCVGDIVGYNADPKRCLDTIRELGCACVRGNHDHYCSHDEYINDFHPLAARVVEWTRSQLSDLDVAFLKKMPYTRMLAGFTVVHSTLDMPERWGYVFDTLEADASFSYQTTVVCFHGHTHIPAVYEKEDRVVRNGPGDIRVALGKKYFINVGSVGQPRDGDGRACYVIYDPKARLVHFRRVAYDLEATQAKIRAAGLPERLAYRLQIGR